MRKQGRTRKIAEKAVVSMYNNDNINNNYLVKHKTKLEVGIKNAKIHITRKFSLRLINEGKKITKF